MHKIDVESYKIKDKKSLSFTKKIGRGTCAIAWEGKYQNKDVAVKKAHNVSYDREIEKREK